MKHKHLQYTLRSIPANLDKAIRNKAKEHGKSLNEVAVEAMQRGMDVPCEQTRRDLSDLAGTWRDDPEFDKAIAEQDQVDREMWQ